MQTERMCKRCGGQITGRRYNATICLACHEAERPIVFALARACVVCAAGFQPKALNQATCGRECHYLVHKHGERASEVYALRRESAPTCSGCGEMFERRRADQKSCSKLCARRVWGRAHPEQVHQRRARTRGVARLLTSADWRRTLARFRHRCAYCGVDGKLTIDHVLPLSRGGRHAVGNVVPACAGCNASKSDSLLIEWRRRGGFTLAA